MKKMQYRDKILNDILDIIKETPYKVFGKYHCTNKLKLSFIDGVLKDINMLYINGISFNYNKNGKDYFLITNEYNKKSIFCNMSKILRHKGDKDISVERVFCDQSLEDNFNLDEIYEYTDQLNDFLNRQTIVEGYSVSYRELEDNRVVYDETGKCSIIRLQKPSIRVKCNLKLSNREEYIDMGKGITGKITHLKKMFNIENTFDECCNFAFLPIENNISSGLHTVLIAPSVVGFICHEAIGHLVEADLVLKGSCLLNYLDEKIAPEYINIVDNGNSGLLMGAGDIFVDDEGIPANLTYIIKDGFLNSFLHNRNTAKLFNTSSTGNSRSAQYNLKTSVRMTNTYLLPQKVYWMDMLKSIKKGIYLKDGLIEGNCRLDGSFTITMRSAYLIEDGKIVKKVKNVTINDTVFNFLNNIIEVGNDLELALGTSSCGKDHSIKVDGGGPHILSRMYLEF